MLLLALYLITWKPEYAQAPPEVRQWYETRELTPETRERLHVQWKSCCNHSDVVHTQFKVNTKDGADEWWYLDPNDNQWKIVPRDTVHEGDPAPDNMPTLFAYGGVITCFFPPGGNS